MFLLSLFFFSSFSFFFAVFVPCSVFSKSGGKGEEN